MKFNTVIAYLAMSLAVCACGHGGEAHHEHEHEHEHGHAHAEAEEHDHDHEHGHEHNATLALSAYSDSYELFASVKPFCIGEESHVLAHVTRLSDFKPVTDGSASATLTVAGKTYSDELDSPTEEGIFELELEPEEEGEGILVITYGGDSFEFEVEVFDHEHEANEDAEAKAPKSGNGVAFSKEKSWRVDFATAECRSENFGQVIKTISKVEPFQGDDITIVASADGIVSFSSLVEGQQVRKGETICRLLSDGLVSENVNVKYTEIQSEYNLAKADYERKLALSADKIVSESDLQAAKSRYDNAAAAYESIRKNYDSKGQGITSNIDGFLRSVSVSNGQFVSAGDVIAVVSKSANVILKAEVQPKYYQSLRNIEGATFHSLNSEKTWTLSELSGKVLGYGKSLQDGGSLVPVSFSVSNRADFLPGTFVETYIRTTSASKVLTVPSGAIVEEMGNYFVYVQLTPEFFEKTQVSIGATDGIRTEIRSGLSEGQRVVSKGAILVKLAQSTGGLDPHAGHVH